MQTSIEWLWEQIPFEFTSKRSAFEVFEQAKQIHNLEIENTYWNAYKEGQYSGDKTAEEYYQEVFKNK
jgi:hypothetical protein